MSTLQYPWGETAETGVGQIQVDREINENPKQNEWDAHRWCFVYSLDVASTADVSSLQGNEDGR